MKRISVVLSLVVSAMLTALLASCAPALAKEAGTGESAASSSAVSGSFSKSAGGANSTPQSSPMREAYRAKVEEYLRFYGKSSKAERDGHSGMTGLCLVQLVDFDKDGTDELLLVYHDRAKAHKGDFFNPDAYAVEVWAYRESGIYLAKQTAAPYTQAKSTYLLMTEDDDGLEVFDKGPSDYEHLYKYNFSQAHDAAAGEGYWSGEAEKVFGYDQVNEITSEAMKVLGVSSTAGSVIDEVRSKSKVVLVGTAALVEGYDRESERYNLWVALELDEPLVYVNESGERFEIDRVQLGSASLEEGGLGQWGQYEGQRVVVKGSLQSQDWNLWGTIPSPCWLDARVVGAGEGRRTDERDEVAVDFATTLRSNYRIEAGEYVHDRGDYKQYLSPTSDLREWHAGNEDQNILVLGSPSRVSGVDISDVVGDAYILNVHRCVPSGSSGGETEDSFSMVVVFNHGALVEHAYLC